MTEYLGLGVAFQIEYWVVPLAQATQICVSSNCGEMKLEPVRCHNNCVAELCQVKFMLQF